ncbi:hypothetical protein ACFLXE_08750, partial [Chloroflexota bacterium]
AGATIVSESPTLRISGIDVPAYGQVTINFTVNVDDPLAAGVVQISNQGTIHYDSDGDGANDSTQQTDGDTAAPGEQATVLPITAGPNFDQSIIAVTLSSDADGNGVVTPGDILEYAVLISNTGNQDSTALVAFRDSIPTHLSYVSGSVSATSGTGTYNAGADRIEWTGDVPAGASIAVAFKVTVDIGVSVGQALSNQGTVYYDSNDDGVNDASEPTDADTTEPGNQTTDVTVGGIPQGVAIESATDVNGGNLEPGDEILYTIVMQNQSGFDVSDIEFIDSIPANTSYVAASVSAPAGATVVGETPTLRITGIDVPAYAQVTISFKVKVDDPLPAAVTQISNQGIVHYDSDGDGVNDSFQQTDGDSAAPGEQATVLPITAGPNFSQTSKDVTLVNDADGNGVITPGDTLEYTVVIPNTGNQDTTAPVAFRDSIAAYLTYVADSIGATGGTATYDAGADRIDWTGNVAAGASVTVIFRVMVDAGVSVGQVISNQGTVYYDSDDDGVNDASEPTDADTTKPGNQKTNVTIGGMPKGVAVKRATDVNGGKLEPGDEILYTIVMQNQSGFNVADIEFIDSIPANTSYVDASINAPAGVTIVSETPTLRITGIDVPAYGQTTISFKVKVDDPVPAAVTQISNQGTVHYDSDGDGINDRLQQTDGNTATPGQQPTVMALSAGPDFSQVTMEVTLTVDADGDGAVSPGDTLEYTIVLVNSGNGGASGVTFEVTPDGSTSLVIGSAITSQGTVVSGNTAGDTIIAIDIGVLGGANDHVTMIFRVTVDNPLPAGVLTISTQGVVNSDQLPGVLTDDPGAPGAADPTITVVSASPYLTATMMDTLWTEP